MIQAVLNQPSLKDVDIVIKCRKYKEFQLELRQIEKIYSIDLNMALYTNLTKVEQGKYFDIVKRDKIYINFYGYKMSQLSQQQLAKVYLLWILKMDQQIRKNISQRYSVIYYHNMSTSITPFILIRDCYKKLPLQYYALLDKIYVIQSSFFLRNAGMFEFGRLYKLFQRRLVFIQNLKELSKVNQIRKNQIIQSLPQALRVQEKGNTDKKKQEETRRQTQQNILHASLPVKKQQKKDCLMIRLSKHRFDQNNLPIHLVTLVQTLRKNPCMIELEGIFRKSGSIQQEQLIISQLSNMEGVGQLKHPQSELYCGYAVAGVIKKIFTKLSQPVVPYSIYNKIMQLQGIKQEDETKLVKDIVYSLPETNRRAILYIIGFIKNQVLTKTQTNKMNQYSMSVVLSPCFFRPQVSSLQDLLNSGRFASIVNILFRKYDQIVEKQVVTNENNEKQKEKRGSRSSNGNGNGSLQPLNTNIL